MKKLIVTSALVLGLAVPVFAQDCISDPASCGIVVDSGFGDDDDCISDPSACGLVPGPEGTTPCVGLECAIERPAEPTDIIPAPPPATFPLTEEQLDILAKAQARAAETEEVNLCVHPNGQLYKEHWEACQNTTLIYEAWIPSLLTIVDVLQAQRDYALMELGMCLEPAERLECNIIESFHNGDLWKPVSEVRGTPVVLTPGNTQGSSCEVFGPDGVLVANCAFRAIANGGRAHWDLPIGCSQVPDNSIFRLTKDGVSSCWTVSDACRRLE